MTFDKEPLNLIIDPKRSYTTNNKEKLSQTKNHSAKVEYFISKWEINKMGGIVKK